MSSALLDETLFTRLFFISTFLPPAIRRPLAHQGATAVLFRTFAPVTCPLVPEAPESE